MPSIRSSWMFFRTAVLLSALAGSTASSVSTRLATDLSCQTNASAMNVENSIFKLRWYSKLLYQLEYDEIVSFFGKQPLFGGLKDIAGSSHLRERRVKVVYVYLFV